MSGMQNGKSKIITRHNLIHDLSSYNPTYEEEKFMPRFFDLLESERCFYRDHFNPGHITGSAILLDQSGTKILMNHHKSLNKWLNFGGHCDGEEDVLAVAIRETMEESGITALKPVSPDIIDIDIHEIPANDTKAEPEHQHFDIRYLMQMTDEQNFTISDESSRLEWMSFEDALASIEKNDSLSRFIKKVQNL